MITVTQVFVGSFFLSCAWLACLAARRVQVSAGDSQRRNGQLVGEHQTNAPPTVSADFDLRPSSPVMIRVRVESPTDSPRLLLGSGFRPRRTHVLDRFMKPRNRRTHRLGFFLSWSPQLWRG